MKIFKGKELDLLGVPAEDMRSFWVNLNMNSKRINKISEYYIILDILGRFGGVYTSA